MAKGKCESSTVAQSARRSIFNTMRQSAQLRRTEDLSIVPEVWLKKYSTGFVRDFSLGTSGTWKKMTRVTLC